MKRDDTRRSGSRDSHTSASSYHSAQEVIDLTWLTPPESLISVIDLSGPTPPSSPLSVVDLTEPTPPGSPLPVISLLEELTRSPQSSTVGAPAIIVASSSTDVLFQRIRLNSQRKKHVVDGGSKITVHDFGNSTGTERYVVLSDNDLALRPTNGPVEGDYPPFAVGDLHIATGKGFGLLAISDIHRGELIVQERPFFKVQQPVRSEEVERCLDSMSEDLRQLFHSFHGISGEEGDKGIVDSNVIPCSKTDEKDENHQDIPGKVQEVGLFEHISRANHSCRPNANWHWDENEELLSLYALQDISAGIEITASYLTDEELLQPHQARRAFILDAMGFHCLCDPCAGPPEGIKASDARVEQIRHFYTEWSKWTGDTVACNHNLRREIETYLALVRDESLPQYAGWAYNMLCHYHASNGQREGVITAARRFVDTAATMLGPKAAAQEPEAQWILHPTTNRCWAEMPENEDDSDYDPGREPEMGRRRGRKSKSMKRKRGRK